MHHSGEQGGATRAQLDEDHPFSLAQREDMRALAVTLLEVRLSLLRSRHALPSDPLDAASPVTLYNLHAWRSSDSIFGGNAAEVDPR